MKETFECNNGHPTIKFEGYWMADCPICTITIERMQGEIENLSEEVEDLKRHKFVLEEKIGALWTEIEEKRKRGA